MSAVDLGPRRLRSLALCANKQHDTMPPSSPSDLIWKTLSPLLQQLEALGHVLEACATYVPWCAGCATGLALLLLTGLVLQDARNGGGPISS